MICVGRAEPSDLGRDEAGGGYTCSPRSRAPFRERQVGAKREMGARGCRGQSKGTTIFLLQREESLA